MRILNASLILIALAGLVITLVQRIADAPLRAEHDQLVRQAGWLTVENPEVFKIVAVETNDPFKFRWRAHFPEGIDIRWNLKGSDYESTAWGNNGNRLAERNIQLEFKFTDEQIEYFYHDGEDKDQGTIEDIELCKALKQHWSELDFFILGMENQVVQDPKVPFVMFKILVPPDLNQTHAETDDRSDSKGRQVFCYSIGDEIAFPNHWEQQQNGQ